MTAPNPAIAQPKAVRLIYASMVGGILIMTTVTEFVLRPKMPPLPKGEFPPIFRLALLAVILALSIAAFIWSRNQVPKRAADQPVDAFWMSAVTPALVGWAIVEGGCLLGVVAYGLWGFADALVLAAVALVVLLMLNPGRLEGR